MRRLNLLLAVLLMICALSLVASQQAARRQFIELERAHQRARQLEIQWDQLQLEQMNLAKASLIDARARKALAMQPVSSDRTLHLSIDNIPQIAAKPPTR